MNQFTEPSGLRRTLESSPKAGTIAKKERKNERIIHIKGERERKAERERKRQRQGEAKCKSCRFLISF